MKLRGAGAACFLILAVACTAAKSSVDDLALLLNRGVQGVRTTAADIVGTSDDVAVSQLGTKTIPLAQQADEAARGIAGATDEAARIRAALTSTACDTYELHASGQATPQAIEGVVRQNLYLSQLNESSIASAVSAVQSLHGFFSDSEPDAVNFLCLLHGIST